MKEAIRQARKAAAIGEVPIGCVIVMDGKIIVSSDAEVTIYTFAGKQVAAGKAGEYTLPAGNYIVKAGNKAIKVRL